MKSIFLSPFLYTHSCWYISRCWSGPGVDGADGGGVGGGAGVALPTDSHKYPASASRWIEYLHHDLKYILSTVSGYSFVQFHLTAPLNPTAIFVTDIVVLMSQFTHSHPAVSKERQQTALPKFWLDPGAGALQRSAFCMLRISQIFSSYPPLIILHLQGKRIQSEGLSLKLHMWPSLRCKPWQNWSTRVLFSPQITHIVVHLSTPVRSGFCFCLLQGRMGERQCRVCWQELVLLWNLTLDFHVWLNTQTIKLFTWVYFFCSWHLCAVAVQTTN